MFKPWEFLTKIKLNIGSVNISLANILFLILSFIITLFLIQFLNEILKKRILNVSWLTAQTREAIAKIIAYIFGTLFFIIILQTVGVDLSALAVVGGGLGIGIGFGLQNLTNNFVSGLTIAFENKIKKEDFIEMDNLKGFVEEILTRATIIRKLDGTRVIIPNSQLTEKSLINWSYSQTISISLQVGVAYGSNLDLVLEQLLQAAYQIPDVVKDPPVKLFFKGFGDNSLNFEMWVSINDLNKMYFIQSDLYYQIEANFRKHQIKIPFPQRDLWLQNPEVLNSNYVVPTPTLEQPQLIRDILKKVSYFANFNDFELRKLVDCGYSREYPPETVIFKQDDHGDSFYIILSGSVEIYAEILKKVLKNLESGSFFGELSLLLNVPRTATVKTITKTKLFIIPKTNFDRLLQSQPLLEEIIIQESKNHQEELENRRKELKEKGLLSQDEINKNILDWFVYRFTKYKKHSN